MSSPEPAPFPGRGSGDEMPAPHQASESPNQAELAQYATAEHFTLQTARVATTTEAVGRATIFLGGVSGVVLALAFIGQVSQLGDEFNLFVLLLLPPLLFSGVVTFVRVLECAIEYMIYERGMNRLRRLFAERSPELRDYLILSTCDDTIGTLSNTGKRPSARQLFLTTAGLIAVIDGLIAGALMAVLMGLAGIGRGEASIAGGVFAFGSVLALHQLYQYTAWKRRIEATPVLFPSPGRSEDAPL